MKIQMMKHLTVNFSRIFLILSLLCVAAPGCRKGNVVSSPQKLKGAYKGYNLVLVSLDTLRYDRLGITGYKAPTSPMLDTWSRDAIMFDSMISNSSWTLPAHHSLFTGQFPTVHSANYPGARLANDKVTLAEVLNRNGYDTCAWTGGAYVSRGFGFAQGFAHFQEVGDSKELIMDELVDLSTRWLENRNPHTPFFLFLHSFDVHVPYTPPTEFLPPFEPIPTSSVDATDPFTLLRIMNKDITLKPPDLEYLNKLYDAEIRFVDHQLGRLFNALDRLRLTDRTIVVLFSDHGETFQDHGLIMTHAYTLYEEVIHVPLLIRLPGLTEGLGLRRQSLVQTVDLMPTLLDLLGITISDSKVLMLGKSLLPVIAYDEPVNQEVFAETNYNNHLQKFPRMFPGRKHTATRVIRTSEYAYILDEINDVEELYSIKNDKHQQQNILNESPAVVSELKPKLKRWMSAVSALSGARTDAEMDPETVKMLQELGYIDKSGSKKQ
ncbi:sulfatase [candidate division CSSED10-310 bacterium]|uniref:Sulfatase n=1 Tax=candidate division CSSED10-310 bacterium TaxID=2855610 RepID=A0ABV6YXK5_UNCC1